MAGIKYNRNMFTVGMISQKLQGNTESDSYNNSLLDCKNFYIRQTGGVFKRPGTVFVDQIDEDYSMKLFPYNLPGEESVIVGIRHRKVIVYGLEGEICRNPSLLGSPVSKLTDDVIHDETFHVEQNGNLLYVFSLAGIFTIKFANNEVVCKEQKFTFPPVGKTNTDSSILMTWKTEEIEKESAKKTIQVLKASTDSELFKASDVGQMVLVFWPSEDEKTVFSRFAYFKIIEVMSDNKVQIELVDRPKGLTEEEAKPGGDDNKKSVMDKETSYFCLPAFGKDRGWPVAAGFAGGRLFLAGSDMMIYGSALTHNDYFDFSLGDMDSAGISYLMSNDCNEINWIAGQDKLFVGTPTGIFISGGSSIYENERITPSTITFQKFSGVPAGGVHPVALGAVTAFCDALEKNVYEISVDEATSSYKTFDLSLLSNELLNSGIVAHAWSGYPVKTYWCVCKNGKLISMTYEKANNVMAWSYHELGGTNVAVESIASIRVDGSDRVFVTVRRVVDGAIVRTVEYIDKLYEPLDNKEHEQHYVDCGKIQKYVYPITNIKAYKSPFLHTQDKDLLPDESYGVKHPRLCLYDIKYVALDVYVDKAQGEGVTLCTIKAIQQKESTEGVDRFAYKKVPLDCHVLDQLSNRVTVGVKISDLKTPSAILEVKDGQYAIKTNISKLNIGDKVFFVNTGLLDNGNQPLDVKNGTYASAFTVERFGRREHSGYAIVKIERGVKLPGDMSPLGELYKVIGSCSLDHGNNTCITQPLDVVSAVALSSYKMETGFSSSEICHDIVYSAPYMFLAVGNKIMMESGRVCIEDACNIRKILWFRSIGEEEGEASEEIEESGDTVYTGGYITNLEYVDANVRLGIGLFKKLLLSGEGSVWLIAGGNLLHIVKDGQGNLEVKDSKPYAIDGCIESVYDHHKIYSLRYQFGSSEVDCWLLDLKESWHETKIAHLDIDKEDILDCVFCGGKIHVVVKGGIIYEIDPNAETDPVTLLELPQRFEFAGGVAYLDKLFLWSKLGDLMLYDSGTQEGKYQFLAISQDIECVFVYSGELYISLSNGSVLKSVTQSEYTLTFIDMTTVCVEDVVGMAGINGKQFTIKHLDTSTLKKGSVTYELWDDEGPVDSSKFGVYVDTFPTNGNVYLYFNKIVGLDHLAGEEVSVCLDGNFLENTTVSDAGVIAFPSGVRGKEAHVGYKYNCVLDLMPLSGGNARGSSIGSVGSQKSVFARLYYSLGGRYGSESDNMFKVVYPTTNDFNKEKKLYTGLIELPMVNPSDVRERKFRFEHTEPVSFNVLSIAQDAEISDA